MGARERFQGRRIDSACLRWAFRSAKHGWNSFLTLNSFPAHIRDFKNLKGIWHQMLARSHQLQSIFRLLKPFLHVQIWCQSVAVFQNHGVFCKPLSYATEVMRIYWSLVTNVTYTAGIDGGSYLLPTRTNTDSSGPTPTAPTSLRCPPCLACAAPLATDEITT